MRVLVVVAIVITSSSASAVVDPAVVGKWQADMSGVAVNVEIRGDGRCDFAEAPGQCSTLGGSLVFQGEAESVTYQWSVAGKVMRLSGGDMPAPLAFQRLGGAAKVPQMQLEQQGGHAGNGTSTAPASPEPSGKAAPEKGARVTIDKEGWGVSLSLPGGWKSSEKDGVILAGSDAEAGLILIRYMPKTSRAEMLTAYQAGINEQGLVAHPVGQATDFDATGGAALAGVLEGVGPNGAALRMRSVGVLSRFGGAVVVIGITSAAQYPTLAARTEAIARSISFRAPPKTPPIAGNYEYVYVSRSGSYSREAKITLCRSGRFTRSGEMAGSGAEGSAVTANRNGGTWQAVGDENAGNITLTWDDGGTSTLTYQVSRNPSDRGAYGPGMRIGDTLYQKTGDGGCLGGGMPDLEHSNLDGVVRRDDDGLS